MMPPTTSAMPMVGTPTWLPSIAGQPVGDDSLDQPVYLNAVGLPTGQRERTPRRDRPSRPVSRGPTQGLG